MKMIRAIFAALILLSSIQADAARFKMRIRGAAVVETPPQAPPLAPGAYPAGAGWAATATPTDIAGSSNQVIIEWTDPPYRTITAARKIGVVAYVAPTATQYGLGKTNPIDYVTIACDGGVPAQIDEPSLNSDTGEIEYWVTMDPANFSDGLHECRAVGVPEAGKSTVLQGTTIDHYQPVHSMFINTDAGAQTLPGETRIVSPTGVDDAGCGDTLGNACRQPWAARDALKASMGSDIGGGVICLMEGGYDFGKAGQDARTTSFPAASQWVTIQPCAGQSKAATLINNKPSTYGLGIAKLRIKGLSTTFTINGNSNMGAIVVGPGTAVPGTEFVWLDDVDADSGVVGGGGGINGTRMKAGYATDVTVTNAGRPFTYLRLARNTHVVDAVDDVYTSTKVVLTAQVDLLDERTFTVNHPDLWQNTVPMINAVLRDINCNGGNCKGQGYFQDNNGSASRLAIVGGNVSSTGYITWQTATLWSDVFVLGATITGNINLSGPNTWSNVTLVDLTCATAQDLDIDADEVANFTILGSPQCTP